MKTDKLNDRIFMASNEADSILNELQRERLGQGKCPHCGFDFQKLLDDGKAGMVNCPCGKSVADLTKDCLRILF